MKLNFAGNLHSTKQDINEFTKSDFDGVNLVPTDHQFYQLANPKETFNWVDDSDKCLVFSFSFDDGACSALCRNPPFMLCLIETWHDQLSLKNCKGYFMNVCLWIEEDPKQTRGSIWMKTTDFTFFWLKKNETSSTFWSKFEKAGWSLWATSEKKCPYINIFFYFSRTSWQLFLKKPWFPKILSQPH